MNSIKMTVRQGVVETSIFDIIPIDSGLREMAREAIKRRKDGVDARSGETRVAEKHLNSEKSR